MAHITDVAGLISAVAAGGSHTIAGNTTFRLTSQLSFNVANTVITATGPNCVISGGDPITTWVQSGSTWSRTAALTDHPMGLRDDTPDGRDLVYHMAANPTSSVADWNNGASGWHTVTSASPDTSTQTSPSGVTNSIAISDMSLISAGSRLHVESIFYAGHNERVTAVSGGLATLSIPTTYPAGVDANIRRGRVRVLNRIADLSACGPGHFVYDSVTDVMTVYPFASSGFSAATTLYASQNWGSTSPIRINAANVQLNGITSADRVEENETFQTNNQFIVCTSSGTGLRLTNCNSRNVGRFVDVRSVTGAVIEGGTSREGFGSYHYVSLGGNTLRGHGFSKMGRSSSEGAIVHMTTNGTVEYNWFYDFPRYAIFYGSNSTTSNVRIEKNIFYLGSRRNADTGMVYTIDGPGAYTSPAVKPIIRNNYFRACWGSQWFDGFKHPFYSHCVYLDENAAYAQITNNIFHDFWFGIFMNISGVQHRIEYNIFKFCNHPAGVTSYFEPFSQNFVGCVRAANATTSLYRYNALDSDCNKAQQGTLSGSANYTVLSDRRSNDIGQDPQILTNTNGWIIGLASTSPMKSAGIGWTDPDVSTWGPRGLGYSGEWDSFTGFGPSGGGSSGTSTATPTPTGPASIIISEFNTSAGISTNKSGSSVRFKRADNALVDSLNKIAVPDAVRTFSYEKWLRLGITGSPPAGAVSNIKFYTDGSNSFGTGVRLWAEKAASHDFRAPGIPDNVNETPHGGSGSLTMTNAFTYTAVGGLSLSSAAETFSGSNTTIGRYLVLALGVDPCADAGTLTAESLNFSYDET